jgi:hypothetical protein
MLLIESKEKLKELRERFEDVKLSLDPSALERELEEIDKKMAEGDFWSDGEKAKSLTQRRKVLEENIRALKAWRGPYGMWRSSWRSPPRMTLRAFR